MTIAATIAALQSKHAGFLDVATAPEIYPTSINAADCPYVLTDFVKGKSEWEAYGGDYAKDEQQYLVRCFVLPIAQGQGVDQGKQAAITMLDTFLSGYKAAPTINSTTAIMVERGFEYTMPQNGIVYADVAYYGFTVVLTVEERDE